MGPVLTQPGPHRVRATRIFAGLAVSALGALALLGLVRVVIREPSFVGRITVANPTVYNLEVGVTGGDRKGVLGLGTVERESKATFASVIDQGDEWIFRFAYGGQGGGELVLSRADLERNRWQVTVPDEVGRRLKGAGVPPTGE